jgi:hypothetical protein
LLKSVIVFGIVRNSEENTSIEMAAGAKGLLGSSEAFRSISPTRPAFRHRRRTCHRSDGRVIASETVILNWFNLAISAELISPIMSHEHKVNGHMW